VGNLTDETAGIDVEAGSAAISGGGGVDTVAPAASAAVVGVLLVCGVMLVVLVRRRRAHTRRFGLAKVPEDDRRSAFPFVQAEGDLDGSGSNGANSTPRQERDASLQGMCGDSPSRTVSARGSNLRAVPRAGPTQHQSQQHHRMRDEDKDEGGDEDEEAKDWTAESDDTAHGSEFGSEHEAPNSARDMRGGGACVSLARIGADAGANCGLPGVRDTGRVSGAGSQRLSREQTRFSNSKVSPPPRASGLPAPNNTFPDARRSSLASTCNNSPLNSDRTHLGVHEVVVEEDEEGEEDSSVSDEQAAAAAEVGAAGGSVLRDPSPRRSNSFERLNAFGRTRVGSGSTGPGQSAGEVATRL